MEITTKTIVFTIISVILVAAILGGVFYLLKNSKQFNFGNKEASISGLPVIQLSPTPTAGISSVTQNQAVLPVASVSVNGIKTYQGQDFILRYPDNWGILTCNDSKNIEFDPYNKSDLINYSCDRAIKPITVLASSQPVNCPGNVVKIGGNSVTKSITQTANWMTNRWCLNKNGVSLDITNRVAPTGITATGKDNFSKQIEQIINNF